MTGNIWTRGANWQSILTSEDSSQCFISMLELLGLPKSLLDVGCGDGHLVEFVRELGVEAIGIDLHCPRKPFLFNLDLTSSLWIGEFEFVTCWEVAEHLPVEAADTLCDTLEAATAHRLIFTAATPGQGGMGHINEQPHAYWIEKLEYRGLRIDLENTKLLRSSFKTVAPRAWWYGNNVVVFNKERP